MWLKRQSRTLALKEFRSSKLADENGSGAVVVVVDLVVKVVGVAVVGCVVFNCKLLSDSPYKNERDKWNHNQIKPNMNFCSLIPLELGIKLVWQYIGVWIQRWICASNARFSFDFVPVAVAVGLGVVVVVVVVVDVTGIGADVVEVRKYSRADEESHKPWSFFQCKKQMR